MSDAKPILFRRVIVLAIFFIGLSGLIGSWIVNSRLLYGAGFWIYGNLGKVVILLVVFFALLVKDRLAVIRIAPRGWGDTLLLILSLVFSVAFVFVALYLLLFEDFPWLAVVIAHGLVLLSGAAVVLGAFGVATSKNILKQFHREIGWCLLALPFLYFGIFEVWKLWPLFSGGVLAAVKWLLAWNFVTRVVPPFTLRIGSFGVEIGEACSGLDSLFMFSVLYWMLVLAERSNVNLKRAMVAFVALAAGLYLLNIVRVYGLVLIGVLWSPWVAVHLFHTYAAMVFFIIYFVAFLKWGWPKVITPKLPVSA